MSDAAPTPSSTTTTSEKPQHQKAVSFNQYLDKKCFIIMGPFRQVVGIIKGWDPLNLVVEDAVETRTLQASSDAPIKELTRSFPSLLLRCQNIESILPCDGYEAVDIAAVVQQKPAASSEE